MNRYYLAVDIGASSGRHILGGMENGKMNLREIYRFSNGMEMVDGTLCWNLVGLFEEIKAGMRECKKLGINPESMGIDTWAVDFVLLDKQGHVLGKTAGYRDRRTEGMDLKVYERISREELYRRTGIQKQIFNTVYQLMAVKEKQPDILSQAESFLMIPDYLNFLLTGVQKQEYTNATTTQLVNPSERTWDRELIGALGYPQKLFGGLSMPGTVVGRLSEDVQKETGLDCRVVLPAPHDTGPAVAAVPSNRDHVLYISSGTWSLMGTELKNADCREMSMEANFTNEGGVNKTIRFLKNIMGLWLIQESRRQWDREGELLSFDELERQANAAEPFASLVDPDYAEFQTPGNMPKRIKEYCKKTGQKVPETKGEVVRCIAESLAFKYRQTVEGMEDVTGNKYNVVNIVGGGIKDKMICQFTANATKRVVSTGPVEATSIGNVIVQAMAMGAIKDINEGRKVVRNSFDIKTYEPQDSEKWDAAYEKWKEIIKNA